MSDPREAVRWADDGLAQWLEGRLESEKRLLESLGATPAEIERHVAYQRRAFTDGRLKLSGEMLGWVLNSAVSPGSDARQ